jgi:hypothetical protein
MPAAATTGEIFVPDRFLIVPIKDFDQQEDRSSMATSPS